MKGAEKIHSTGVLTCWRNPELTAGLGSISKDRAGLEM